MFPKQATDEPATQEEAAITPLSKKHEPSTALASAIVHRLPFAIVVMDREGAILRANQAWEKLCAELNEPRVPSPPSPRFAEILEGWTGTAFYSPDIDKVLGNLLPACTREFSVKTARGNRLFLLQIDPLDASREAGGCFMATLTETTRQHKIAQDLRESHSLFQRVVEGTGDAVFIYDTHGRFLMHNTAGACLFSQSETKLAGKKIEDVFPPSLAQTIRTQNELVLATGRTVGYEIVLPQPQGDRTLLIQKGIYRNHQNRVVGIIAVSRDITERKLAEEKLERSERHFRALIEKSNDCIGLVSEKGDILYVSPPAVRMFGFEIEHWIGANIFFWIHPDELKLAQESFQHILAPPANGGAPELGSAEVRVLCKSGQWKWVEVTASNLLNDAGIQAIVLNVRDISERKQAEQDLQRFQAIINCSIDAIFSIDLQGLITSWNPAAARILGYDEQEMIGQDHRKLVPADRMEENDAFFRAVLRGKASRDVETMRQTKDGRRIEVSLTFSPIHSHGKTLAGVAVILRDITEHRRLEKEVLEISDFEKQRIGQDLHDDLCQHLVGISMVSSRLQKDLNQYGLKQADDAGQITTMLRTAVDHARMLARGLSPLDFSADGLKAALAALVINTTKLFRIPCEFECGTEVKIGDHDVATHLFRITQEALNNAVKHSRGTKVLVRMERRGDNLEISVADNGVGLCETEKPRSSGLGMHTMNYRARIIGASLSTSPNSGGGLTVTCRYQLPRR